MLFSTDGLTQKDNLLEWKCWDQEEKVQYLIPRASANLQSWVKDYTSSVMHTIIIRLMCLNKE